MGQDFNDLTRYSPQELTGRYAFFYGQQARGTLKQFSLGEFDLSNLFNYSLFADTVGREPTSAEVVAAPGVITASGTAAALAAKQAQIAEIAKRDEIAASSPVTMATSGELASGLSAISDPAVITPPAANATSNSLFGNLFTPGGSSSDGVTPAIPTGYYLVGALVAWYLYKKFF